MNDIRRQLLHEWMDGTLPDERRAEVEAWLGEPEVRRYVAEHRAVWTALGAAFVDEPIEVSSDFRDETVRRARAEERRDAFSARRFAVALAAGLLIALGLFSWWRPAPAPSEALDPGDHEVVRHLHVLRDLELVERRKAELDLRGEYDVLMAFAGEVEEG
ncbi:MAG: hypothetical protein H6825_08765 [Planctomycetes bacterium]|nr:hypothetical protein [Planctomycetota bacterium]